MRTMEIDDLSKRLAEHITNATGRPVEISAARAILISMRTEIKYHLVSVDGEHWVEGELPTSRYRYIFHLSNAEGLFDITDQVRVTYICADHSFAMVYVVFDFDDDEEAAFFRLACPKPDERTPVFKGKVVRVVE